MVDDKAPVRADLFVALTIGVQTSGSQHIQGMTQMALHRRSFQTDATADCPLIPVFSDVYIILL